jgi:Zn-dependent peptidase ImmA (M78 family)
MNLSNTQRREPIRGIGVVAARAVRASLGYAHPTELAIDVLAYMRGAVVRSSVATGARANLLRVGTRGVIGVAGGLSREERRWAIAHELGHFEAHASISFVGLCTARDMVAAYETSGREPEANAFAAELLMPEDLAAKRCDVASLSWNPVCDLAHEFGVSVPAAAIRFIELTAERACVVSAKDGVVAWASATKDFGAKPQRGARVQPWTESHAFFARGEVEKSPQTVSASAWIEGAGDDEDLMEHVFVIPTIGVAMSLLWWKSQI